MNYVAFAIALSAGFYFAIVVAATLWFVSRERDRHHDRISQERFQAFERWKFSVGWK